MSTAMHAIPAIHLSRYCTYLVAYCPGLLPSNDEWCKKLYKDAKKEAERVLLAKARRAGSPAQLLQSLAVAGDSENEVLKNGTRLGMQLTENLGTRVHLALEIYPFMNNVQYHVLKSFETSMQ